MVMENFEQAAGESWAIRLMLTTLFAMSPEAMTRLMYIDAESLRETLGGSRRPKEFIDRALETIQSVQEGASDWSPPAAR